MNTIGTLFRMSIFGESHGKAVGVTVDGMPAGVPLKPEDFEADLSRRRSGAKGTTPRKEPDLPELISGVFNGYTTGAPITILFENTNVRSKDYSQILETPRPGHSDFFAGKKYGGYNDYRGGGHFSGRLTANLVAAGVLAKKLIEPVSIEGQLLKAGGSTDIDKAVAEALEQGDSVGGLVEVKAEGLPVGLGEPFFNKAEAAIAQLLFSLPAIKGLEFGAGFQAASMQGSEHNDPFVSTEGKTATNNAGGITGGMTTGNSLICRLAIKPTSSISRRQHTMNMKTGEMDDLELKGRHDACIALRVPPVAEAALAIALADLMLLEQEIPRIWKRD